MSMSPRGTVLLVALLAVLAGYLYVVELSALRRPPIPKDVPDGPPLLRVPPASVARVDLETDGVALTAVRTATGWADPEGRPWGGEAISDLVETLAGLRPLMVVDPDPGAPADYGLTRPAGRLQLTALDGRTVLALDIGDRNPAWTGLYARLGGRAEVVLVGGVLRWELDKVRKAAPRSEP